MDLGFHDESFSPLYVNEYFLPFMDAYQWSRTQLNHTSPEFGYSVDNIEDILANTVQEMEGMVGESKKTHCVGFIGGPPCPDFSVGGKNRGRLGENGKLSKTYIDLIYKTEPDWFLFENVKGLWRTKRHREFFEEIKTLIGKKYTVSTRLMNSIECGAPQDRDRIFMFGIRKDLWGNGEIIDWDKGLKYPGSVAWTSSDWPKTSPYKKNSKRVPPKGIIEELTVEYWFKRNSVLSHLNGKDHFTPRAGLKKFESIKEGDDSRKSFKRLHRWRYSPTAAYGNNEVHIHPYKPRRISAAEAMAIQSMPKNFSLPPSMSLTNKFKTIGNGVPYLMSRHVAKRIRETLRANLV